MTENQLFTLLRENLLALMLAHGAPSNLAIVRNYQTTQQGRNEEPTIYLSRQALMQVGSPSETYEPGDDGVTMVHRTKQVVELQVQFQASLTYNLQDRVRSGDLLVLASMVMGTLAWRTVLFESKVQMQRISGAQHTFRINDQDQYEPVPILLAKFNFTDVVQDSVPYITKTRFTTERV